MTLRLGITMRITNATGYDEPRDALAHDWGVFLSKALPEALWIPIPNIGVSSAAFAQQLGLTGLIFSGGDNIGVTPTRDQTERTLLSWASHENIPVLGVCRGMQLLHIENGGLLKACKKESHVATSHSIQITNCPWMDESVLSVNSYHNQGIPLPKLASDFTAFAHTLDKKWAEGCLSIKHNQIGIMWHPERTAEPMPLDLRILHHLFIGETLEDTQ